MNTGSDSAFDEFIDSPSMFEPFENQLSSNPSASSSSNRRLKNTGTFIQNQTDMELSNEYTTSNHETSTNGIGIDAPLTQPIFRNALGFVTTEEQTHQHHYTTTVATNNMATSGASTTRTIAPTGSPHLVSNMQPSMLHPSNGMFLGFQSQNTAYHYRYPLHSDPSQPIPIASPQLSSTKKPIITSPIASHSLPSGGDGSLSYSDFYSSSLHHARSPDPQNPSTNPYKAQQQSSTTKSDSVNNPHPLTHMSFTGIHTPHSSTPSPSLSLSPSDANQLAKREKNRLAAERCRRKKQELIGSLSSENQQLQQEILELRKVNQVLEQKLDYLLSVMASYGTDRKSVV